ncbi:MAG: 16S rRNA (cytosine(1402)-N(4))-methyltransferase RsmH [Rhodothermales bacterium]|nr:16S rRNA (cytosine(1402)-N(4))-methyltransferase RsmH [Rhodothermales bacterium]MBO6778873.1 16S rRNA (cytosine(1402)-N(4))-methyltransferase RsmH [Rhodothermales bacterium]
MNPYASGYHEPVLCKAVVNGLVGKTDGYFVDATLGGGGHTAALLDALDPAGTVIGIDQDDDAIAAASHRLQDAIAEGRLQILQGNFADLEDLLSAIGVTQVDGILLDLGVSSHQFDAGQRGFSHRLDGPLDMRMSADMSESAADLLDRLTERELRRLLREFGEEPRAGAIAREVIRSRPLTRTFDLVGIIERVVPPPDRSKALARVFQALRIEVNDEMRVLENVLAAATALVRPEGRIAVISYHSLEDRRVKRYLRYGNLEGTPRRDIMGNLLAPWRPLNKRPIIPDAAEVAANPRSRSARLRLAERLPLP